jgi:hypothetical protein
MVGQNFKHWISSLIPVLALALAGPACADEPAPQELPPPREVPDSVETKPVPPEKPVVPEKVTDLLNGKPNGGPDILKRPVESKEEPLPKTHPDYYAPGEPFQATSYVPAGFTGRSSVVPREVQVDGHFVPAEDRWRIGLPEWDRYGKNHPRLDDYPYDVGRIYDPYRQNVLKGDYAIFGQNTFFELTLLNFALYERRQVPVGTGAFESTARPFQKEFFGRPDQETGFDNFAVLLDFFHGDAAFKPVDWRIRFGFISNLNTLGLEELAVVNPDVRKGIIRNRTFTSINETFVEKKIADLSPNFDFVSVRAGAQQFVSDFRGFIFNDINLAFRIFGNYEANRDQFNLIYFENIEKDTNSGLIGPYDRDQHIFIANFFRQDFIFPGFTGLLNFHYNRDEAAFHQSRNSQTVRPDIAGNVLQHGLDVFYLGFGTDGHINRYNVTSQFYVALGRDSNNPIGNVGQDIKGYMAALELSYDRDYVRFRGSYFYASGDGNPNNGSATGFDSIIDNPNFAGTEFSYFQRQEIGLFGVNLKQRLSLFPDLRSIKIQGQSNFVNPGLQLFNLGFDVDVTPKIKVINNYNLLWFDKTAVLQQFLFQGDIDRFIGADLSMGIEYRPLLNNNVIVQFGLATLIPGEGFRDLYNRLNNEVPAMFAAFTQLTLKY